jgi:hypothetical protein
VIAQPATGMADIRRPSRHTSSSARAADRISSNEETYGSRHLNRICSALCMRRGFYIRSLGGGTVRKPVTVPSFVKIKASFPSARTLEVCWLRPVT